MTTPPRPQTSAPPGTGQAAARRARPRVTALLALPGALALLAGLDAALLLLELPAPVTWARLRDVHGPLLVLGFVGTLIALERAVALRAPAGFAAPALLGAGAVLLLTPLPERVGGTALLLGAIALIGCYVPLWRRQRGDAVLVQLLGAVLAAGAVTLWLGGVPVPRLIPWLAGFVVLTVAAERVELARIALPAGAERGLLWASGAVAAAITAALLWPAAGYPVLGLPSSGSPAGSRPTTWPGGPSAAPGSSGSPRAASWRRTPGSASARPAGSWAGRSTTGRGTTRWFTPSSSASPSR